MVWYELPPLKPRLFSSSLSSSALEKCYLFRDICFKSAFWISVGVHLRQPLGQSISTNTAPPFGGNELYMYDKLTVVGSTTHLGFIETSHIGEANRKHLKHFSETRKGAWVKGYREKTCDFYPVYNIHTDLGEYCVRGYEAPTTFQAAFSFLSSRKPPTAVSVWLAGVEDQSWVNIRVTSNLREPSSFSEKPISYYFYRAPCDFSPFCYHLTSDYFSPNLMLYLNMADSGSLPCKDFMLKIKYVIGLVQHLIYENSAQKFVKQHEIQHDNYVQFTLRQYQPNFFFADQGRILSISSQSSHCELKRKTLSLTLFRNNLGLDFSDKPVSRCKLAEDRLKKIQNDKHLFHNYCLNLSSLTKGGGAVEHYLFFRSFHLLYNDCDQTLNLPPIFQSCEHCLYNLEALTQNVRVIHCAYQKSWTDASRLCHAVEASLPILPSAANLRQFLRLLTSSFLPKVNNLFIGLYLSSKSVSEVIIHPVQLRSK